VHRGSPPSGSDAGTAPRQAGPRFPADDGGNAALELVIIGFILFMIIALVIAVGRVTTAQDAVDAAARDAARQASIALTPAAAQATAVSSAEAALRQDGVNCTPIVTPDVTGFSAPLGQSAPVSVTVTCTVSLASLSVPGMPGSATLRSTWSSPLDPFRSR
jgi:Flp pilus assembly protein TadG